MCDHLTLREFGQVLTKERAETKSMMSEVRPLEGCMRASEEDLKALRVGCVRVDELTPERASLTAWSKQLKAERDNLAARICELEGAAERRNGI